MKKKSRSSFLTVDVTCSSDISLPSYETMCLIKFYQIDGEKTMKHEGISIHHLSKKDALDLSKMHIRNTCDSNKETKHPSSLPSGLFFLHGFA